MLLPSLELIKSALFAQCKAVRAADGTIMVAAKDLSGVAVILAMIEDGGSKNIDNYNINADYVRNVKKTAKQYAANLEEFLISASASNELKHLRGESLWVFLSCIAVGEKNYRSIRSPVINFCKEKLTEELLSQLNALDDYPPELVEMLNQIIDELVKSYSSILEEEGFDKFIEIIIGILNNKQQIITQMLTSLHLMDLQRKQHLILHYVRSLKERSFFMSQLKYLATIAGALIGAVTGLIEDFGFGDILLSSLIGGVGYYAGAIAERVYYKAKGKNAGSDIKISELDKEVKVKLEKSPIKEKVRESKRDYSEELQEIKEKLGKDLGDMKAKDMPSFWRSQDVTIFMTPVGSWHLEASNSAIKRIADVCQNHQKFDPELNHISTTISQVEAQAIMQTLAPEQPTKVKNTISK